MEVLKWTVTGDEYPHPEYTIVYKRDGSFDCEQGLVVGNWKEGISSYSGYEIVGLWERIQEASVFARRLFS